jgi:LysM repeat protein
MTYGKHRRFNRLSRFRKPRMIAVTGALALSPILITVHAGDTLSGIAAAHGKSLSSVEAANPSIRNPNLIYAGQSVALPGSEGGGTASYTPRHHHASSFGSVPSRGGSSDLASVPGVPYGYAKCVAFRESTNNPHAVNSIPGYIGNGGGAYGFLQSTWSGLGYSGSPQTASVAQQKAAFSKLYSQLGRSPWTADGC